MKNITEAFSADIPLPAIQSVGAPPEKHADRVVAEMLQLIACAQTMVTRDIQRLLAETPDGNPKAQEKLRSKLQKAGGLFFPAVILEPGREDVTGSILFALPVGTKKIKSLLKMRQTMFSFLRKPRLAQRYKAKTPQDLLIAVTDIFITFLTEDKEHVKNARNDWIKADYRLKFKFDETFTATAVINRYEHVNDKQSSKGKATPGVVVTIV